MRRLHVKAAVAAALLLLQLCLWRCSAQSPTGNITRFEANTLDVKSVFIDAQGGNTEIWLRVNETQDHPKTYVTSEFLSTYDHNLCQYGAELQGDEIVARVVGSNSRCDMRFILEVGQENNHWMSVRMEVNGNANIELMPPNNIGDQVRTFEISGNTVRFSNPETTYPNILTVRATEVAYLDIRNLYVVRGEKLSSRSKIYHALQEPRECPYGVDCETYDKSQIVLEDHGTAESHDIRTMMEKENVVFVGGGDAVTKNVTFHPEAADASGAAYMVDFQQPVSDTHNIMVTIGNDVPSHISDGEKPNFDDPPAQSEEGAALGRPRVGFLLVCAVVAAVLGDAVW